MKRSISKTQVINPLEQTKRGFSCELCQLTFASYDVYLDHTHSRDHIRMVQATQGVTVSGVLQVERVDDPQRIRDRLAWLRQRRIERETALLRFREEPEKVVQERIERRRKEEEEERKRKKEAERLKKKQSCDALTDEELDEDSKVMQQILGITSFK